MSIAIPPAGLLPVLAWTALMAQEPDHPGGTNGGFETGDGLISPRQAG
jgi:hypothetical protein